MDLLRSLPIGLYLEKPVTWLHKIDPRIKLVWLMTFLLAPLLANPFWRLGLSGLLILLTFSAAIPLRVWRQQMGLLLTISLFILVLTAFAPDGLAISHQPRLPPDSFNFIQPTQEIIFENQILNFVAQFFYKIASLFQANDYRYVLADLGRFTVTRRSLDVAIRISTLIFTLIYSTNLYLLTTAPEEITAGLEDLMSPLRWLKIPVTEIALTLTLALRFIPLVLEEVQNLFRSVRTRAINWKKLGVRGSAQVWLIVVEKLLENLLMRAEQIAIAMDIRGFTSPNKHRVQWHQLRLRWRDWLALGCLIPFWIARIAIGGMF